MSAATASANLQGRSQKAILIDGIHKHYAGFHALRNVSLTVSQGEKIVVCGPSGSGKSTMIRCINRLEEHTPGRSSCCARNWTTTLATSMTFAAKSGWYSSTSTCFRT